MITNQTILLVDDEDNDAILVKRALAKAGVRVGFQRVHDGEDAIHYLKGDGKYKDRGEYPLPSLIILDLKMPRKNGFEVLKWIRAQESIKLIPIVVFTSSKERSDVNKAYDSGASAYMVKPNSFDHMVETMRVVAEYWLRLCAVPEVATRSRKGD